MIQIQNVGEALHLIETQVFKDLAVNPFRIGYIETIPDVKELLYDLVNGRTNTKEQTKEILIKASAILTRLLSENI